MKNIYAAFLGTCLSLFGSTGYAADIELGDDSIMLQSPNSMLPPNSMLSPPSVAGQRRLDQLSDGVIIDGSETGSSYISQMDSFRKEKERAISRKNKIIIDKYIPIILIAYYNVTNNYL